MKRIALIIAALSVLVSCQGILFVLDSAEAFLPGTRHKEEWDKVMILYSAACNDISGYLQRDINELVDTKNGACIPKRSSRNAVIIVSHQPKKPGNYNGTVPVVINAWADEVNGKVAIDRKSVV